MQFRVGLSKNGLFSVFYFCATVGLAAIESANIVGYQNLQFDKSGWMINAGVAFSNVGADGTFTIDDTTVFGNPACEGDQIVTLDAELWDLNTIEKAPEGEGWIIMAAGGAMPEQVDSMSFKKGDMIYFIPAEETQLTIAGQVAALGEQSITFDLENEEGQWMFPLVNPFPVATTWKDLDAFCNEGDQLITLDADMWDLNTFEKAPEGEGWILMPAGGGMPEAITDDTAIAIPAGGSAYYIPVETVTWTVSL